MSVRYLEAKRKSLTAAILPDDVPDDPTSQFTSDSRKVLSAASIAVIQAAAETIADNTGGNADEIAAQLQAQYGPQFANATAAAQATLTDQLNELADNAVNPDHPDDEALGESDNLPVKGGLIRGIMLLAGGIGLGAMGSRRGGGGADSALGDGSGSISGDGGIGSGQIATGMLGDNGITPQGFIWDYSFSERNPFQSHEDLDGVTFAAWDDDQLAIQPGDEWLDTAFYSPGDHDGCLCQVVRDYGDEGDMGFPSPGGEDITDEVPMGDLGDEG